MGSDRPRPRSSSPRSSTCARGRGAPGVKSSAGKTEGHGATGHGTRYLARPLGEAAVGVGRTRTFLGARYRRLVRRGGMKKAAVAAGRPLQVIVWHLLAYPNMRFRELGSDSREQ